MRDYYRLKQEYPDHLLLYQKGSFYELFGADAVRASEELPLRRSEVTGMVGFPMHRSSHWIPVFHRAGFTLAIADQVKIPDPRNPGREIIRPAREVTRIITPGTLPQDMHVDFHTPNYLLAIGRAADSAASAATQATEATEAGHQGMVGLAWADITTGEVQLAEVSLAALGDELVRISPAEILISQPLNAGDTGAATAAEANAEDEQFCCRTVCFSGMDASGHGESEGAAVTRLRALGWGPAARLQEYFVTSVPAFWSEHDVATKTIRAFYGAAGAQSSWAANMSAPQLQAMGQLLMYLQDTQKAEQPYLAAPGTFRRDRHMSLNAATRRSLELVKCMATNRKKGSLLSVLDQTMTGFGGRELRGRLTAPLMSVAEINHRLDVVEFFHQRPHVGDSVRRRLKACADIQRQLQFILAGLNTQISPAKAAAALGELARTLNVANEIAGELEEYAGDHASLAQDVSLLQGTAVAALAARIGAALGREDDQRPAYTSFAQDDDESEFADDNGDNDDSGPDDPPPRSAETVALIQPGFSARLDEIQAALVETEAEVQRHVERCVEELCAASADFASSNTKRKFAFVRDPKEGHVIETLRSFLGVFQAHGQFQRCKDKSSATLRFTTPDLVHFQEEEHRLCGQQDAETEQVLLGLYLDVNAEAKALAKVARGLASLDVATTLARVALAHGYTRPEVVDDAKVFDVTGGRHAVVDALQPDAFFMPNDCRLDEQRMWLITGPNMGGKSTFLRQNALIAILAQVGSFVPAARARLGVTDCIFTRIGASDNLAENQSTFMVEMVETAAILRAATPRSFVVLDEIGRGTGAADGLALAFGITQHLHDAIGCRTLFATHLLPLTELCRGMDGLGCYQVAVAEGACGEVDFSHRIVPGVALQSHGIAIARLAGLPAAVTQAAAAIRPQLDEIGHIRPAGSNTRARTAL